MSRTHNIPSGNPGASGVLTPFRVSALSFNDGTQVDTESADIVVLVGPNNTGKTRTLQEIHDILTKSPVGANGLYALHDITIDRTVDTDELISWLKENRYTWSSPISPDHQEIVTFGVGRYRLSNQFLDWKAERFSIREWERERQEARRKRGGEGRGRPPGPLADLAPHLVRALWCSERLEHISKPTRRNLGSPPEQPLHLLTEDDELLDAFCNAVWDAFHVHVIIDAWGADINIRLSRDNSQEDFQATTNNGLPNRDIARRMASLPLIETQSDGVRSFAGILLTMLTGQFPTVLIDEPEEFLHPPQARLLGQYLARLHQRGQIFIATHSIDVLLGLMEERPERLLVIRLTRDSGISHPHVLPSERLREVWRDPLLRFSRALDGLFHHGVVVCEGDTDSQFYSSITEAIRSDDSGSKVGRDIMFTYAGSKQRIPLIARALSALGVPVRIVVDFDALADQATLRALTEGVGGTYSPKYEKDRRLVESHIRGSESALKVGSLREALNSILGDDMTSVVTQQMIRSIRQVIQPTTGWQAAKLRGKGAVPAGDATVAVERLLNRLREDGVFVVPCGEVESFVKAIGGKGPRWVVEVIEGGHVATAREAREFVGTLLHSLQV